MVAIGITLLSAGIPKESGILLGKVSESVKVEARNESCMHTRQELCEQISDDYDLDKTVDEKPSEPDVSQPTTCEQVGVICGGPGTEGGGGGCWNDPAAPCGGCIIELPQLLCDYLGIDSTRHYTPKELREIAIGHHPNTYMEAWNICLVFHETRHSMDGPLVPECQTEENATDDQAECLRKLGEELCNRNIAECGNFLGGQCALSAKKDFHHKRCELNPQNEPQAEFDPSCPKAVEKCRETLTRCMTIIEPPSAPWVNNTCDVYKRVYCERDLLF